MNSIIVMLPTYNERENIKPVIRQLLSLPLPLRVVVVDDLSPDGTGEIVERLRGTYPSRLEIIHRGGPRGRGRAGITGFRYIANLTDISWMVEMDADGSHQPKHIPEMLQAGENADVVIGSRYIAGGGVQGWGPFRHLNSRVAGWIARMILGLKVRDVTSGFRLFRHEIIRQLPWNRMISDNPSIVEEILFHCAKRGFRIIEVPIIFLDRKEGKSKFSVRFVGKWIMNLIRVRKMGIP